VLSANALMMLVAPKFRQPVFPQDDECASVREPSVPYQT
jgi:hypothetical protein